MAFIGFGTINQATAKRLAPFGCRMVAVTRSGEPSEINAVETMTDVHAAVADADHVVVGAPLTPSPKA
ncbi:MAG: hypothetical protein CM1200mP26_23200 [Acidimicrobiales bacterium]|nr:MAG: hypothetical protein CM1200mP26_23200 [Acidimicrobiales bacterium]